MCKGWVFLYSPISGETWWSLSHSWLENFDNSFWGELMSWNSRSRSAMRVFVRNSMTHTWSVVSSTPAIGRCRHKANISRKGSPWQRKIQGIWVPGIFAQELWHNFMWLKKAGHCNKVLYSSLRSCQAQFQQAHPFFALFNFTFPFLELGDFALLKPDTNHYQFRTIHPLYPKLDPSRGILWNPPGIADARSRLAFGGLCGIGCGRDAMPCSCVTSGAGSFGGVGLPAALGLVGSLLGDLMKEGTSGIIDID